MEIRGITAVPVNVPTVTVAAELSIIEVNSTITNDANDLAIQVIVVLTTSQVITIDTKNKTITLADGTNVINALQDFPVRPNWLPLEPGVVNGIDIVDAGHSTYTIAYEDGTL
jgi:phage-related protein